MGKIVTLSANVPTNLYSAAQIAPGSEIRVVSMSDGAVLLFSTPTTPTNLDFYEPLLPGQARVNRFAAPGAWAQSADDAQVVVEQVGLSGWVPQEALFPAAALRGEAAVNVQFYDESNRKLGSQWGASRRLLNATNGQKFYSVLKTRTLPVDLKAREFSYTWAGVIGRFYTGFTPQTLPAPEPVYSLRPGLPAFRDFDLYALAATPASLGSRWSYDLILQGNAQSQGKGVAQAAVGQGWVIEPQTEVLLEIESLDAQTISATLAMFNGLLDLPIQ